MERKMLTRLGLFLGWKICLELVLHLAETVLRWYSSSVD